MRNKLIYICACIVFFIFLFSLNPIVYYFIKDNYNPIVEIDNNYTQRNDGGFYNDKIKFYYDLFQIVDLEGWCYYPTDEDNVNKKIKLIFKSDKHTYEIMPGIIPRDDIYKEFKDVGVKGNRHGFITTFSTLNFKDGVYNFYIYCEENDKDKGLMNTNLKFEKKGLKFAKIEENKD